MGERSSDADQSALIEALRRENRRLWGEIEARQAVERERTLNADLDELMVNAKAADEPSSNPPANEADDLVAELLEAVVGAVSLAIHDESTAMAAALTEHATRAGEESEARLRSEHAERYAVLAARLDRVTTELMSIREILDDLREARRAGEERPGIVRFNPADAVWRTRSQSDAPRQEPPEQDHKRFSGSA